MSQQPPPPKSPVKKQRNLNLDPENNPSLLKTRSLQQIPSTATKGYNAADLINSKVYGFSMRRRPQQKEPAPPGVDSSSDEEDSNNRKDNTMTRNRGPRPAYSDANMQRSLGYLP